MNVVEPSDYVLGQLREDDEFIPYHGCTDEARPTSILLLGPVSAPDRRCRPSKAQDEARQNPQEPVEVPMKTQQRFGHPREIAIKINTTEGRVRCDGDAGV